MSQLGSPMPLSFHLLVFFNAYQPSTSIGAFCSFFIAISGSYTATGAKRDWQRGLLLCSLLLKGKSRRAPQQLQQCWYHKGLFKDATGISSWADGWAREGSPGWPPSLCGVCAPNKSIFAGRLS